MSLSLSGYLAEELGWEWDFYFFGILGLVFCCFWMILIHSSPSRHPKISKVFVKTGFFRDDKYVIKSVIITYVGRKRLH